MERGGRQPGVTQLKTDAQGNEPAVLGPKAMLYSTWMQHYHLPSTLVDSRRDVSSENNQCYWGYADGLDSTPAQISLLHHIISKAPGITTQCSVGIDKCMLPSGQSSKEV